MKITCNVKKLRESLQNVQRAVASKSSIEVLEGVLIKAEGQEELFICGYNLEIGITTSVVAKIEDTPCGFVIDPKILIDILRKTEEADVFIEINNSLDILITSGQSKFSIKALSSDDYPILPSLDSNKEINIESTTLKRMIKQTIFAASVLDDRPVNTGTLFDIKEGSLTLVSVDNFRLAKTCTNLNINSAPEMQFIVPAKTLAELTKLMPEEKDEENSNSSQQKNESNEEHGNNGSSSDASSCAEKISIFVGEKHVVFAAFGYSVISRRIEGNFLDYNTAIPKTSESNVKVNTKDLINCIDRVSVLISERVKSPVRFKFTENLLHFSCQSPLGESEDNLPLEYSGAEFEIGLNSKYILDALKNADTDVVNLDFTGPLAPVKVTPPAGDSFLFLVLPVRLVAD